MEVEVFKHQLNTGRTLVIRFKSSQILTALFVINKWYSSGVLSSYGEYAQAVMAFRDFTGAAA